jgi:hypothetical protein
MTRVGLLMDMRVQGGQDRRACSTLISTGRFLTKSPTSGLGASAGRRQAGKLNAGTIIGCLQCGLSPPRFAFFRTKGAYSLNGRDVRFAPILTAFVQPQQMPLWINSRRLHPEL